MTSSTEVELKYGVPDGTAIPDLAAFEGLASVEAQPVAQLEAVYFDTADRTLLRARIALRRRTGGHDAGWHVKLPAAGGRRELHAPIDPARPDELPRPLERALRSRLRGRPIEPIARIATERRGLVVTGDGGGRVEVVDDAVRATDVAAEVERSWREWEAEQLDEDGGATLSAVDAALQSAGARRSASPAKLAQALGGGGLPAADEPRNAGERLAVLIAPLAADLHDRLTGLAVDGDADGTGVHGLRKTIRRIRSLLALTRIAGPAGSALRERLGVLAARLGEARDPLIGAEVAEALLGGLAEGVPGAAAARRLLVDEPRAEVPGRTAEAVELLLAPDAVATWAALDGFRADGRDAGRKQRALTEGAARSMRQVRRRARSAHDDDLDELHRVRKSAKRARMVTEELVGAGLLRRRDLRVAKRVKRVQERLGEHRDLALVLESLPARSDEVAAGGGNAYAFGVLHERGRTRLHRLERRARRSMRRLGG